jgi:hypothetical protein
VGSVALVDDAEHRVFSTGERVHKLSVTLILRFNPQGNPEAANDMFCSSLGICS